MKKTLLSVAIMMASLSLQAADANYNVVPLPQNIEMVKGKAFVLDANTVIVADADADMQRNAQFLADFIKETTGIQVSVAQGKTKAKSGNIILRLNKKLTNNEGYQLTVDGKNVTIEALTPAGVFYGIQTLRKSLPVGTEASVNLPATKISDAPRFGYRGGMLDCARHFFPVSFVKQYIDMLALHNLNTFHWHLTEDQGWRMEVKKYPKLTQLGAIREQTLAGHYGSGLYDGTPYGEGMYYTEAQMREIVDYAAKRYITVIPEIDMPGHMLGALRAYPELGCTGGPYKVAEEWGVFPDILCAGKEETFKFVENVLDELCDIFPSKTIHLGGDEAPRVRWEKCPLCQKRIKDLNITGKNGFSAEAQLQVYFLNRVAKYLKGKGRNVIGWDEILEGDDIDPATTVMSWRGVEGGKTASDRGLNVIMSPTTYYYLDYYQTKDKSNLLLIGGNLPVEKTYSYNPVPDDASANLKKHVVGVQANLWTEYIPCASVAEYQLLPRLAAMAETGWTANDKKDFNSFKQREGNLTKLYDTKGWAYCKEAWQQEKK
ncbi:glycosyl hydrolase family 20, catalytic domain protein [Prevotella sp. DNF00663]|uniref:beta-N-acetylhexosaminidase n=1 Tax=unclassified Prevotella TaxID=2638335 RepID=UPI000513B6BD|nr:MULTISPECIES: beta-N-acetylhexosaminidase [unclassified Prevotella]KGI61246.1 beta-N-acetylhexosaminidase [Prevotella sp. S7 MS 2]KXB83585.1 glycosyl hydrolase family 20, catalytic domain protein [Prevotella sp. DNF00663]